MPPLPVSILPESVKEDAVAPEEGCDDGGDAVGAVCAYVEHGLHRCRWYVGRVVCPIGEVRLEGHYHATLSM